MMLFEELNAKMRAIELLAEEQCVPILKRNILYHDPEMCERQVAALAREPRLAEGCAMPGTPDEWAGGLARFQFDVLTSMPGLIRRMEAVIESRAGDPSDRLALACVLAYLVNPFDVIPDEFPGGKGVVDDAALLLVVGREVLHLLRPPKQTADDMALEASMLLVGVPKPMIAQLNEQLRGVWAVFHVARSIPPEQSESLLHEFLSQPLELGPCGPGFQPPIALPVPTFLDALELPPVQPPHLAPLSPAGAFQRPESYAKLLAQGRASGCAGDDFLVWES